MTQIQVETFFKLVYILKQRWYINPMLITKQVDEFIIFTLTRIILLTKKAEAASTLRDQKEIIYFSIRFKVLSQKHT